MFSLRKLKLKLQLGFSCLSLTKFLYLINVLLIFCLINVLYVDIDNEHFDTTTTTTVLTVDKYLTHIENSMQIFDYMLDIKRGLVTKTEPMIETSVNDIWCWKYPTKPQNRNVIWNAQQWQLISSSSCEHSSEIYVYSAYYDIRLDEHIPNGASFVQIFAMVEEKLTENVYCHIWWSNDDDDERRQRPLITKAVAKHIWEKAWDPRTRFYVPFIFTCPIQQKNSLVPRQVSLTRNSACQTATNLLPVNYELPEPGVGKQHAVICVKGMDFLDDLSLRFVEWLEANYVVGADKIVIYTYAVHPEMRRVIEYYEKNNKRRFLNVPLTLPGRMPNAPLHRSRFIKRNRQQKRRNEIIPYNDCLYKHLYTHEYVLIVDVDELVVPLMHDDWKQMLDYVKRQNRGDPNTYAAFSIANAFFFDNLTSEFDGSYHEFLHMLRHDVRSTDISGRGVYGKSFTQIKNVATVFNHFPVHKLRRNLRPTFYVDARVALKNHYKETCPVESRDECPKLYAETTIDHSIRKFANEIKRNVERVLKQLNKL